MKIFRKVELAERAPSLQDFMKYKDCSIVFIYKDGIKEFWSYDTFIDIPKESELIEYWLEEIELPSEEELLETSPYTQFQHDVIFMEAAEYIMNKIIL